MKCSLCGQIVLSFYNPPVGLTKALEMTAAVAMVMVCYIAFVCLDCVVTMQTELRMVVGQCESASLELGRRLEINR